MAVKIKTDSEISLMKKSGEILAYVFSEVDNIVLEGISTKEIDKFIYNLIRKKNAKPSFKGYGKPPYSASSCISINDEVIHGIPSKNKILKNGDIVGIDIGVYYKGYHSDRAFTYKVGSVSDEANNLIHTTQKAFFDSVSIIKEGIHIGDVSHRIQKTVESNGLSVVRDFQGHGIGSNLHEEPNIPNYGKEKTGIILKKNMVLAIEPMVNIGKGNVAIKDDNWTVITVDSSLSAHYEHTVCVKEDGFEILTAFDNDKIVNKYLLK